MRTLHESYRQVIISIKGFLVRVTTLAIILTIALGLAQCTLFEYHPYEVRVPENERDLNRKAISRIQEDGTGSDTLTVILMGDTQRFYDEVEGFVNSANKHEADFVILNGDISDFGTNDEFGWIHDIMKKLNKPYVAVIGNHDLSGNGELVFKKRYGEVNTSFIINGYKFILLNTNSREYRFNGHVPDLNWLTRELSDDDFDRAIIVSHIAPFSGDFDPDLESGYATALAHSGKVNLSLHGHEHRYQNTEYYGDGVRYVISSSMDKRVYVMIKLWESEYSIKEIYY